MKKIDDIIMKYKCQVLPDCSEDWNIICKEVAKEYAEEVLGEIIEEIGYYTEGEGCTYINEKHIAELKRQIDGE